MTTAPGGHYKVCIFSFAPTPAGDHVLTVDLECDTTMVGQATYRVRGGDWQKVKLSQGGAADRTHRTAQAFALTGADWVKGVLLTDQLPTSSDASSDDVALAVHYAKIDQPLEISVEPGAVILELNVFEPLPSADDGGTTP